MDSDLAIPLLIGALFLVTFISSIFKQWIGFSLSLILAAGLMFANQTLFPPKAKEKNSLDAFRTQMLQAVEDFKNEVHVEKTNLLQVANQVQEVIHSIDTQKQKLQQFIEETHERIKTEYQIKSSNNNSQTGFSTS